MEEDDKKQVDVAATAAADAGKANGSVPTPQTGAADGSGQKPADTKPDKTFSQSEVDSIIKDRLAREDQSMTRRFLNKYGCADETELDSKIKKADSYDATKAEYDKTLKDDTASKEELALVRNGVDPARYEDVRIHFKGKGTPMSEESLKNELKTHPEWLNKPEAAKTTLNALGSNETQKQKPTPEEMAAIYLGLAK